MAKHAFERYEKLKSILQKLDQPIMQMADQIAAIKDKVNSKVCFIPAPRPRLLCLVRRRAEKRVLLDIQYRLQKAS
jgi:hypothetical protein